MSAVHRHSQLIALVSRQGPHHLVPSLITLSEEKRPTNPSYRRRRDHQWRAVNLVLLKVASRFKIHELDGAPLEVWLMKLARLTALETEDRGAKEAPSYKIVVLLGNKGPRTLWEISPYLLEDVVSEERDTLTTPQETKAPTDTAL